MKKLTSTILILFLSLLSLPSWALPACPSNQNAYYHNCFGTFEWNSGKFKGDKYVGEWKDDKQHGQGIYYYSANNKNKGDIFIGQYKKGQRDGQGTYIYSDGDKYVGEYKDDIMDGQGIYIFAEGEKYLGEFKDGKAHGQGTATYTNGNQYIGEFNNHKYNGDGIFIFADGKKYLGKFSNGKLNGFAIKYDKNGNILKEGIWKDDVFQYAQKKSSGSSNSSSKLNKYKDFCKEIGFTPGTEKFAECVLKSMEVE